MSWPAWIVISMPLKLSLWIINRLATWTGLFYLWRRLRTRRFFWAWVILINIASLGGLALSLLWLHKLAVGSP